MARADAELTHPNPVCLDANALYARAIAFAVRQETEPDELYENIVGWARDMRCDKTLQDWIASAEREPPRTYTTNAGWVKVAFGNALYQLLHAADFEEAVRVVGVGDRQRDSWLMREVGELLPRAGMRQADP